MFQGEPWKTLLQYRSENQKRIIFMILSYTMYFIGVIAGSITFFNEYARLAYIAFIVFYALWNGNKYYIALFNYTKHERIQTTLMNLERGRPKNKDE